MFDVLFGIYFRVLDSDGSILVVKAKCFQDTLENKVTFDLTEPSGRISSLFSINSGGVVKTLQNLDYEEPPTEFTLIVMATEVDTDLKSTAEVILIITALKLITYLT